MISVEHLESENRYNFNCMLNETANKYMHTEHNKTNTDYRIYEKKTQIQNQLSRPRLWEGKLCGSCVSSSVSFCRWGKSSSLG